MKLADLSPDYDFSSVRSARTVRQRLPRLPVRRHEPGRPSVRHAILESRSVQPRLLPPSRKGHQQRFEHVRRPGPANVDRQLLSPGLHLSRLHAQFSFHYDHDEPSMRLRPQRLPGPARSRSASLSRTRSMLLFRLGGRRPHQPLNIDHAFYWVSGRNTLNPMAGQPEHDPRRDGRPRIVVRPRLGAFRTSLSPPSATATTTVATRHMGSIRSSTVRICRRRVQLLATAGDRAIGVNLEQPTAWCRTSIQQVRGTSNFVNPGLELSTSAWISKSRRSSE